MKNCILLLIGLGIANILSAQNADEEAIKEVIRGEGVAFLAGDMEKVHFYYAFKPYSWGTVSFANGASLHRVGDAFDKFYDPNVIKPKPNISTEHKDFSITINGKTAWATNIEVQTNKNTGATSSTRQLRCLEKIKGSWKIVALSAHFFNPNTPQMEEEAIKTTIIGETTAWANGDFESDFNSYSKSDWTEILHNNIDLSYKLIKGSENIRKSLTETYQRNPGKQAEPNTDRSNWSVKILSSEWAWATYDEKFTSPKGITLSGYNTRLMHKEEGKWRISALNGLFDFKNPIAPTPNPTEEDIKKVITDEGTAFRQGNIDGFMDTQADVPYLLWTVTNGGDPGDVLTFRGYNNLKEWAMKLPWFKAYKPDAPNLPTDNTLRDNWQFQIKGTIAIVNFDEHVVSGPDKSKLNMTTIKIMERIGGKWKIINTAALADFKDATPPIRSKY